MRGDTDSTRVTVEQMLARNYDLKRVDIHVKSTADAFPDMLKNAGRKAEREATELLGKISVGVMAARQRPHGASPRW